MNFREGFRRIGLTLGLLGMSIGLVASYLFLQQTLHQRAEYERFMTLLDSKEVKDIAPDPKLPWNLWVVSHEFDSKHPSTQGIRKIVYGHATENAIEITSFEMTDDSIVNRQEKPALAKLFLVPCFP